MSYVPQTSVSVVITGEPIETIDAAHQHVHEGIFYNSFNINLSVAAGATEEWLLFTGNVYSHTAYTIKAGGDAFFRFYEGVSVSTSGTQKTLSNNNRNSGNTSSNKFFSNSAISTSGTTIAEGFVVGGTGDTTSFGGEAGAFARGGTEWLLKPNTIYGFRCLNNSGAVQPMSINVGFYEVSAS